MKKQVFQSLKTSEDYRYAFVEERIQTGLAAQIHAIREQRGLDPKQFAEKLGKKLAWVYRLEDPNQPPPTIPSLIEVAKAYDCDLEVRFKPFSETLDDINRLSPDSLRVASFKEEYEEIERSLSMESTYGFLTFGRYRSGGKTDWISWEQALAEHIAAPAPLESHYWGEVTPAAPLDDWNANVEAEELAASGPAAASNVVPEDVFLKHQIQLAARKPMMRADVLNSQEVRSA